MSNTNANETGRRTKVERVVEDYGLQGIESELADRWTGEGEDRHSLRDLARYFNERVLEAALEDVGVDVLDGETENFYRLLSDDDISAGRRTETRARLEREGVDVDAIESDFVSHQAIHTFLTERYDVSYEGKSSEERVETARNTLNRLEGRIESVAANNVERLQSAGDLDIGDASVLVSLDIICNDCGRQYGVETLLQQGGCDCADTG